MNDRTLRGKVAVVGVGETPYYRHGKSPQSEVKLALMEGDVALLVPMSSVKFRDSVKRPVMVSWLPIW